MFCEMSVYTDTDGLILNHNVKDILIVGLHKQKFEKLF